MYADSDDSTHNSEPIRIPGAGPLGSEILYPFDPIAQLADVFPQRQTPTLATPHPLTICQTSPFLPQFVRFLGKAFLFVACLAFPLLIPFVYVIRRGGRR